MGCLNLQREFSIQVGQLINNTNSFYLVETSLKNPYVYGTETHQYGYGVECLKVINNEINFVFHDKKFFTCKNSSNFIKVLSEKPFTQLEFVNIYV